MKLIVTVNYVEYVLDAADGMTLLALLEKAERYENKYRSEEDGGSLHYVYSNESHIGNVKTMSDDLYRMARLAGKPERS